MQYTQEDLILPMLKLGDKVEITVNVTNKTVSLCIGPRDWQWDRKTGELIGCGTFLG